MCKGQLQQRPYNTLPLHDALPIFGCARLPAAGAVLRGFRRSGELDGLPRPAGSSANSRPVGRLLAARRDGAARRDRKNTRLNSRHLVISYSVFYLQKKNKIKKLMK